MRKLERRLSEVEEKLISNHFYISKSIFIDTRKEVPNYEYDEKFFDSVEDVLYYIFIENKHLLNPKIDIKEYFILVDNITMLDDEPDEGVGWKIHSK